MSKALTISIDAMGGDRGVDIVVPGLEIVLTRRPGVNFLLYGHRDVVMAKLQDHPKVAAVTEFIHTEVAISMGLKPSQALRQGRRVSSMWCAIDAVKQGRADVVVSAGNTGALMAMAKVYLKTMAGIDRPAMAAIWPTIRSDSVVLDVGATVEAGVKQLVDFAVMGEAMARVVFGIDRPTVGLLNIGVEEMKGIDEVKAADQILRHSKLPIDYYGFVEGDDLGRGTVDVVVTNGFTGNVALKAAEGTAGQLSYYLRQAMARSLFARVGGFLAQGAFAMLKDKMDPRKANGGVFLGLNGIVVKSHGSTDPEGFANAVDLAIEMADADLVKKIAIDLAVLKNNGGGKYAVHKSGNGKVAAVS